MMKVANEYYPFIVETIQEGVWVVDKEGKTLYVNSKMAEVLGTTVDEMLHKSINDYVYRESEALDLSFNNIDVNKDPTQFSEYRYKTVDGREVWTNVSVKPFNYDGDGGGLVMLHTDITKMKRIRSELPITNENIDLILASLKDYAVMTTDKDRRILSWNIGAKNVFGYDAVEMINQSADILFTPEDRATRQPEIEFETALRTGSSYDNRWHLRKDGSSFFANGIMIHLAEVGKAPIFIKIARDWTEKKKIEEVLLETDRHKNEFLATLAHELRNPLASILSGIEVLKQTNDNDSFKSCQVVERQVQQMIHLVNDLLDISRISLGKIKIVKHPVNLIDSIHLALDTSRQILEGYKHTMTVSLPPGPIIVEGDFSRLSQVFLNILVNSAKYTPPGGTIAMVVETNHVNVTIRVRDNGMGIPANMLSSIFKMFEQIQDRSEYPQAGLGIGLSVVKQLVEMHNGTVEAYSDGPNLGSEFLVTLPVYQKETMVEQPDVKDTKNGSADIKTTKKKKVLLVDDNADAVDMLEILLKRKGYIIRKANDGESGIAAAIEFNPEIVILDLGLPDMDGYAVLEMLQRKLGKRCYLALSGWGQQEDIVRSKEAGFDRHLVKPIDIETLLTILEQTGNDELTPAS